MWRSGSASPCQGEGREFESRHPLGGTCCLGFADGGVAERRGSGLQSRLHGFESRRHLGGENKENWAIGAVVARFPDTEEVTGSNPVSPTRERLASEAVVPEVRTQAHQRYSPAKANPFKT
jgi:hypothetical protein